MSVTSSYLNYVVDQLASLRGVTAKRMFGGIGLYSDARFFGLIDDDVLFLRVDDRSRGDYLARDMPPFHPVRSKPEQTSANYYQVPGDVLDDAEELAVWARRALVAAQAAPASKRVAKAKPKKKAVPSRKGARPA